MTIGPLLYRFLEKLLRIFFKLLYHQFSWTYDLVASIVSAGQWNTWVLSVLPDLKGPRVLELGHGPGHLMAAMVARSLRPVGLDESRWMGRVAGLRLCGFEGLFWLVNGYAQFLPFCDKTFNTIVSTFPSEYISDPRTLLECFRVLIPDGDFVILPIAWTTGKGWRERLSAWLFRVTGQAPDWDDRYVEPLVKAGFRVHVERRSLETSLLLVIHAKKPETFD